MIPVSKKVIGGGVGLAIAVAVPLVAQFEGLWLVAKPDRLAYGIPTVCYGETEGVKVGDKYTQKQCEDMLAKKLPRYAAEIDKCFTAPVSEKAAAAFISLAYNVGSRGVCESTALKKWNAGDKRGACDAFMSWTRAGGRVVQGLINRRKTERKLCLEGI